MKQAGLLRFDHAVFHVRSLGAATRRYQSLGFHVTPGGRHAGGMTQNALISLADGSYLELLAPAKPGLGLTLRAARRLGVLEPLLRAKAPFARYFARHLAGREGLADWALHTGELDAVLQRARRAGLRFEGPFLGERLRPDGVRLAWRIALPDLAEPRMAGLPFLIEDETPRELRVPRPPTHPNGALGAATLQQCGPPPAPWRQAMAALLGPPAPESSGESAGLTVGDLRVSLRSRGDRIGPRLGLSTAETGRSIEVG